MKILVVGQGGREHAIVQALKKSSKVNTVYCAPGNGGIEQDAVCLNINETDFQGLVDAVNENEIDITFVGPENPLLEGIVDFFTERKLQIIGPNKKAAQIEGSKSFAKELMKKYKIPTGDYQVFESKEDAITYVQKMGVPIVIKADGLAAGKGVIVAHHMEEALDAINSMMESKIFGKAGERVVVEEYLEGEELTVMAFVDGETVLPMEPAQDHKPVFDGDKGPNTGGMGTYSPVPQMNKELLAEVYQTILKPVAKAMVLEGYSFRGILYAGLMITSDGIKVIEFNARFGDPETQVILPRLKTDLADIFTAICNNGLGTIKLEWDEKAAVCVVMSSKGYPGEYLKGLPITIKNLAEDTQVFIAGAKNEFKQLVTSGGRVLGVTALGSTIKDAKEKAYIGVKQVNFEGAHFRNDIADKAISK
ncbi:MAG: phosphoribosylamine--glycine ligase [Vulcanibacillus sp.]